MALCHPGQDGGQCKRDSRNHVEHSHLGSDSVYLGDEAVHAAEAKFEGVGDAGLCSI